MEDPGEAPFRADIGEQGKMYEKGAPSGERRQEEDPPAPGAGNRGDERDLQGDHADDRDDPHRPAPAVLHDREDLLAGAGAEKTVRRVGEAVDMKGAGGGDHQDDGKNARHRNGQKQSKSEVRKRNRPPDQEADDREEGERAPQHPFAGAEAAGEGDDRQKL